MTKKRKHRSTFGTAEQLPSGRWRAFYRYEGNRFTSPTTYATKSEATAWIAGEQTDRSRGVWSDPRLGEVTLADFAREYLATRTDLAPRTRNLYERSLERHILPRIVTENGRGVQLGLKPLGELTPALIRAWHAALYAYLRASVVAVRTRAPYRAPHPARVWAEANNILVKSTGAISPEVLAEWHKAGAPMPAPRDVEIPDTAGKAQLVHAYQLLHAILAVAVRDGIMHKNPCQIVNGRNYRRKERPTLSAAEVVRLAALVPLPYSAAVTLAAWSGLRFGELFALARRHLDLEANTVTVERALLTLPGVAPTFGLPKTEKSARTVALPEFVMNALREHLDAYVPPEPDALVFTTSTGSPMTCSGVSLVLKKAKAALGRNEITWHDLRHTGATLAYDAGASQPDVQARLGHTTARAAAIYAHTSHGRDQLIAQRLNDIHAEAATSQPRLVAV
jgi:integrase